MKSYRIHLIRHGLTEGNLLGQYIGKTDLPLCKRGMEDLIQLKKNNIYPDAQVFYCSPLKRCTQSLNIIYPQAKPKIIDDFRETDFGEWEGKTADELSKTDKNFAEWLKNGKACTPPNGESGGVFMQRTCLAFEKLVKEMMTAGTTEAVIMAHGGTIMSILTAYGLPKAKYYEWMVDSGYGYSIQITPGLWMRSMIAEVYDKLPNPKITKDL